LFFFVALLVYGAVQSGLPPWSAYPFMAVLGLLLLFPLSSDPMDKIPPERLGLWPLTKGGRFSLRIVSLLLSPLLWLALLLLLKTATLGFAVLFLSFVAAGRFFSRMAGFTADIRLPLLPGRFGGLVSHNLRQMLIVLDTWVAVLIGVVAFLYRLLSPHPDPEALPVLGILVALALSTYSQALFGLDSASAMTRYRLFPLRGWQILLAKDVASLAILLVLVMPLSPLPALTFGLTALAIGHHSSVMIGMPQRRWRFTGGRLLPVGALQAIAGTGLAFTEMRSGSIVVAPVVAAYLVSVWVYGRGLETRLV
jgi:hypothetical protein